MRLTCSNREYSCPPPQSRRPPRLRCPLHPASSPSMDPATTRATRLGARREPICCGSLPLNMPTASTLRRLPQDPSARLISNIVNNQADPANPVAGHQHDQPGVAVGLRLCVRPVHGSRHGPDAGDRCVGSDFGAGRRSDRRAERHAAVVQSIGERSHGTGTSNPLQNPTSMTSYFDLSQVYGSDLATDNALRTFSGGQMKTSPGGLPPLDNGTYFTAAQLAAINASVGGMANNGPLPESQMFVTGDTRGNENVELTALQTLFLDNHNRIAAELAESRIRLGPTSSSSTRRANSTSRSISRSSTTSGFPPCWARTRCPPTPATIRTSMPRSRTNSRPWPSASATAC